MAYEHKVEGFSWYGNAAFKDVVGGHYPRRSIMQMIPLPVLLYPTMGFKFFDDFYVFDATNNPHWTITEDGSHSGSDGVQAARNGFYRKYCDGDDNDEAYVHATNEIMGLSLGKDIWFEARVQLTEAQTNKANYILGVSENVGANHMQDAGAGPPDDYDGIVWFKPDATMSWFFETSLATAQVTSAALLTHVTAHVYRLGFWAKPTGATTYNVYPWYIDESAAAGALAAPVLGAAQALTLTGHGEMQPFFGVKNGGTGAEEYFDIDYIFACQER